MQKMSQDETSYIVSLINSAHDPRNPVFLANGIWGNLQALRLQIMDARPKESGELSRRYAIVITELEKLMGYFDTFVRDESMMDD